MRKIWVVAKREYLATVRTKAFLISIVMMPIMMTLGAGISIVTKKIEDQGEKIAVVVHRFLHDFEVVSAGVGAAGMGLISDERRRIALQ